MPFGLDLMSIMVGILLALFVIPRILGFISARKSATAS